MKKFNEFIRDNGVFRNCESNIAKANIFQLIKERPDIYGYESVLKLFVMEFKNVIESFSTIFSYLLLIVLFPLLPFISSHYAIKRAKKNIKRAEELKD